MALVGILRKKPEIKTLDELNVYFQKIDTVEGLSNISDKYYNLEQKIKLLDGQLVVKHKVITIKMLFIVKNRSKSNK